MTGRHEWNDISESVSETLDLGWTGELGHRSRESVWWWVLPSPRGSLMLEPTEQANSLSLVVNLSTLCLCHFIYNRTKYIYSTLFFWQFTLKDYCDCQVWVKYLHAWGACFYISMHTFVKCKKCRMRGDIGSLAYLLNTWVNHQFLMAISSHIVT